ncbi:MAG: hypothetical protein NVS2B16_11820 [Chloroflexota bacterium]
MLSVSGTPPRERTQPITNTPYKDCIYTSEIRWRILTLHLIVTVALAFGAGVGYWAHNVTHDQVRSQLVQPQIGFPPAKSPAIKALPAADAGAMTQYAGQTMTTGDQAQTYAQNFIAVHLKAIGQGKTYAYWPGLSLKNPTNQKYAGMTQTLFRGETLRSLLLQAWAFWLCRNPGAVRRYRFHSWLGRGLPRLAL